MLINKLDIPNNKILNLELTDGITPPKAEKEYWEDSLIITLEDNGKLRLFDNGQDCCEHRYMHTDDNLEDFVGATLLNIELRDGPDSDHSYGVQESQFLIITTAIGQFTIVNYNEHNGYYGGFALRVEQIV